jgi:surface polysaccharide O-acyltransferase-like enzyme
MGRRERSARIQYLDVLRVLSMLAVVLLHTVAGTLRAGYGSPQWHFSNALTSLATAGVPLFFMISGALLLSSPSTASVGYTLKKRVPRVLIPFLLWSLIAVAYYLAISWRLDGAADWTTAVDKLKHLPARPTAIHLWFMYALIPLYILSPFIKKMVDSLDRKLVIYLLSLWLFFSALLPTVAAFLPESYSSILVLDRRYDPSVMAGYAGYFVAGYYLMQSRRSFPKRWLSLIVLADAVCIVLGTWWKTSALGAYGEVFKTYSGVFVVVLSCALFLLFKELLKERRLGRFGAATVSLLAPLAFGVYLVHNLLVDLLSRLVPWWPAGSIQVVVVSYLAVLAASIAVIFVLSRIKPLCYVLTGQVYRPWRKRPRAPGGDAAPGESSEVRPPDVGGAEAPPAAPPAAGPAGPKVAGDKPAVAESPDDAPTVEIPLPKVWRPEPAKVKPPQRPDDTAERPGRDHADHDRPDS